MQIGKKKAKFRVKTIDLEKGKTKDITLYEEDSLEKLVEYIGKSLEKRYKESR